MRHALAALVGAAAFLGPTLPTDAHHSFASEYDQNQVVELRGMVTRFEWTNPHVRFYVDVRDEDGNVTHWDLELMSVNTLSRAGWTRHALEVGDEVVVSAYKAKDGSNRGNARGNVRLVDGTELFAGDPPAAAGGLNR
jgi:Family of unknown function (DUF6152)